MLFIICAPPPPPPPPDDCVICLHNNFQCNAMCSLTGRCITGAQTEKIPFHNQFVGERPFAELSGLFHCSRDGVGAIMGNTQE